MKKNSLKLGNEVTVITGRSKGQLGKLIKINKKKNTVLVENVNLCKKAVKPSDENQEGGFIETEAPIHISNVMLRERYEQKRKNKTKLKKNDK